MPSSVIRSYRYDPQAETLDLTFVSGRRYRYCGVPAEVAQGLDAAESRGRFFNAQIRDVFAFDTLTRQ
jgi:lysyl-tRNA synthetase class 2